MESSLTMVSYSNHQVAMVYLNVMITILNGADCPGH